MADHERQLVVRSLQHHFETSAAGAFAATGLVHPQAGVPRLSASEGSEAGRALLEAPSVMGALRDGAKAATRLMAKDGHVIALSTWPHGDGDALGVGVRLVDDADLLKIAERVDVQGFHIQTEPSADQVNSIDIPSVDGEPPLRLAWQPGRPGDGVLIRALPVAGLGALLGLAIFALLVRSVRRIAVDLASTREQAQSLAGRDPLSGLPNRRIFTDRLDQELNRIQRSGGGVAVLFLDLDRFKEVNDTYGHQAGDEMIRQVAQRLMTLLRGADTLARFGGDEFAIIQTNLRHARDAEMLSRRILDELTRPFVIADTPVSVGVSIGVAQAPENGVEGEVLMRLADTALYQAKSDGRNRFSFFENQMDEKIRIRKLVEDDLREAIASDQLDIHYQPIYSADGERVVALEALVRWPHPTQGVIPPAKFIAMAEQSGLIIPLGEWVMNRACADGKRWPGVRIAINVSPIQFRHRDFVATVMRAIRKTGFEPNRLELELTEGVVVEDADAAEAAMMELRGLGVHLALDDFGTGYSSLIYLRRFAFDKIKIDRSFLESMEATGESAILVHSIVHLGRALGLTVTAEGVETKEQHRFLQALGCHELQGYLFSRPVPAHQIDDLLRIPAPAPIERASAA
jgi:diguanylate cyclase (GGDEF)-like protein